jgi:peptidyl-prolyl cis-trans isomerase C
MNSGYRCSGLLAVMTLAGSVVFGSSTGVIAAEGDGAPDPVIASVDGEKIYASDFTAAQAQLPAEYQQIPAPVLFDLLINSLIDTKLSVAQARREGFDKKAEVVRLMTRVQDQILQRAYLEEKIEIGMTEEAIKRAYETFLEKSKSGEEVRASHILVETEAQAKELIAELARGAKFFELAKAKSIGPTADKGGDLGFFKREGMVAEFSDVAFLLKDGETTKTPVRSQYGWHVIRVIERRKARPPMFEEVEGEVRNMLTRDIGIKAMKSLRADAEIKRFGPDGSVDEAPEK